jgi:hypothetical protein
MRAIEAALNHRKALGTQHHDVPEWSVDDGKTPLRVFWTPLTISDRSTLSTLAEGKTAHEWYVEVLVKHAVDAAGDLMFSKEDKPKLRTMVDSTVVMRIASAILGAPKAEDLEKN